jgi:hypothetical protein
MENALQKSRTVYAEIHSQPIAIGMYETQHTNTVMSINNVKLFSSNIYFLIICINKFFGILITSHVS